MVSNAATTTNWIGPFFGICASCTWAYGSVAYSKLSKNHSTFAVNFSRALVALPLFLLTVCVVEGGLVQGLEAFRVVKGSHIAWFCLSMVASYGLGDSLFFMSTRLIGVPSALAIGSAYPILTALAGVVFVGEALQCAQWAGLVIVVIGVVTVILKGVDRTQALARRSVATGVLLAVATAVCWSFNSFAMAHVGREMPAAVANTVRMCIALGLCAVFGRVVTPGQPVALPVAVLRRSLGVFFVEAFAGSYFYILALKYSTLAVGATLTSLAPVIAVPVALVLRLERFSLWRTAGVFLVVGGVWLLVGI